MNFNKLKIAIIFVLGINYSFAQLTVKGNNYVYVNNEVLTVVDDLNLNDTDSRIYLRNEGQLVQRTTGTSNNSGIGELSVYQEGTVNSYAFNYWCSPIGLKTANTTNNTFGIPLLYTPTDVTNSNAVTYNHNSDYNGVGGNPINIEPYWIYSFVNSNQYSEWVYLGDATTLAPGLGFTMKGVTGTTNQQYDFRGKPNDGTISNTVSEGDLTLIGNPYPSALDAYDFIWDSENQNAITGDLYFWEQDASQNSHYIEDYVGGYATYTISAGEIESFVPATFSAYMSNGTPVSLPVPESGVKIAKRYIPIGQGFMVEGKTATTGTVKTKNAHRDFYRESGADSYFFRTSNTIANSSSNRTNDNTTNEYGLNIVPEDYKRFRINVIFNDTYTRQLLQNFHTTATDGFDYGLEAKSPLGVDNDAHWVLNDEPYVIQAFNFEQSLTIPLVVKVTEQQPVNFSIFDIQNFDDNQPIFLHDIDAGLYIDLRTQNYDINLEVGTYTNRFEITFTNDEDTLSIPEETLNSLVVFQNNNAGELTIKNPNLANLNTISLFDMAGKQIFNTSDLALTTKHTFSTRSLSDGIYLVTINLEANKTISKKIIVKNNK